MVKLRVLSGKEVCAILRKAGFEEVRRRGSHIVMQKQIPQGTITVPVPDHNGIASALCSRSFASPASRVVSLSLIEGEGQLTSQSFGRPRQALLDRLLPRARRPEYEPNSNRRRRNNKPRTMSPLKFSSVASCSVEAGYRPGFLVC